MDYLVKYNEIFLKSRPVRSRMRRILAENIRNAVRCRLVASNDMIRMEYDGDEDVLKRIFGIDSFSAVHECEKNMDKIKEISVGMARNFRGTFAVASKRSDKAFPLTSRQINETIGSKICRLGLKVDLDKPDNTINIEIRDKCYIYGKIVKGAGGLPLGASGTSLGLIGSSRDMLSDWLLMKRGVKMVLIGKRKTRYYDALKKWHLGKRMDFYKINGMNEMDAFAKRLGIKSVVSCRKVKTKLFVINPLEGFTNKEMKEKIKAISS